MSRGFPVTKKMRDERRRAAEARQLEYNSLSLQEKLDRLPPEPQALKQRAKLLKQLAEKDSKLESKMVEDKDSPKKEYGSTYKEPVKKKNKS